MSEDIHELLREIDKAVEGHLAMGAKRSELALKIPRAAEKALIALCPIKERKPGDAESTLAYHYADIPIVELIDGPFMSFGIDWFPFKDLPPSPPDHFDVGAKGRCTMPEFKRVGLGEPFGVIERVDPVTGYVAIRLRAMDPFPCPYCGQTEGHGAACRIGQAMESLATANIEGDIARIRATPLPVSPATFIAQEDIKAGDMVDVDLSTGKLKRAGVTGHQATQIIVDDPFATAPAQPWTPADAEDVALEPLGGVWLVHIAPDGTVLGPCVNIGVKSRVGYVVRNGDAWREITETDAGAIWSAAEAKITDAQSLHRAIAAMQSVAANRKANDL